MKLWKITRKYVTIKKSNTFYIGQNKHSAVTALFRQQIHVCTCVSLVRWHRWTVGIVGRLPQVMTSSHTLAWLVRWHRWFVGIVGRLPEVMTSQLSHGWSVGIVGNLASLAAWPPEVMTSHALAWLVRWHRWSVGIVGPLASLAGCQRSWLTYSSRMVGPLASLVRWQAARGHDVTALSWYLVRWHRWHRWQAARVHDVTRTLSMVGPLASLVRWQAARGHDVTHSRIGYLVRWHRCSVGIVGRLPDRSWRHDRGYLIGLGGLHF